MRECVYIDGQPSIYVATLQAALIGSIEPVANERRSALLISTVFSNSIHIQPKHKSPINMSQRLWISTLDPLLCHFAGAVWFGYRCTRLPGVPIQEMGLHGGHDPWLHHGDYWIHRTHNVLPEPLERSRVHYPDRYEQSDDQVAGIVG
jgi:hypothetical protein